jgi:protein-S-isoprenylcysteine O-methyltransferase Ste14
VRAMIQTMIQALELKVPPPVAGSLAAGLAWAVASLLPVPALAAWWQHVAGPLALLGMAVCVSAFMSFGNARTTINPLRPDRTSTLVTSGAYQFSRNPMYVGMVLTMMGWALYLLSLPALVVPLLLAAYLHRFQILPEERVLSQLFGDAYQSYARDVRRWL